MSIPILKWAGNKRWIASWLLDNIDNIESETKIHWGTGKEEHYYEPFCGTSSMFLKLSYGGLISKDSVIYLNDINPVLINLHNAILSKKYNQVREKVKSLIKKYEKENSTNKIPKNQSKEVREKRMYYKIRRKLNNYISKIDRLNEKEEIDLAAITVFINKTCYNGLWRVNPRGIFNVPEGSYPSPAKNSYDETIYKNCHDSLKDANLSSLDWTDIVKNIPTGSLIYFDPPYFPSDKNTSVFSDYGKGGFRDKDHHLLIEKSIELASNGCKVILSNHDSDEYIDKIIKLSREHGVNIKTYKIPTMRKIAQKSSGRGIVDELLIFLWK